LVNFNYVPLLKKMNLIDKLLNNTLYRNKYKTDSEAVIIACYFNPQNNPYRLKAFNIFYDSIKHLNHRIVECTINNSEPELPKTKFITHIHTSSLLWHKEALLNNIIKNLDRKFKYVFWLDADIIFTDKHWLVNSVEVLKYKNILQPFEYCVHLEKDKLTPTFKTKDYHPNCLLSEKKLRHPNLWRSFCANYVTTNLSESENYDLHGHVGFAWGARRDALDKILLYDRALIGGADHIMAHAAAGHIGHTCITKSFTDDIEAVNDWSRKFYSVIGGSIGYVEGEVRHIWHGDLTKRDYLNRIKNFTNTSKTITEKDSNGLHITSDDSYVKRYFEQREVKSDNDGDFLTSMVVANMTDSAIIGNAIGGNMMGSILGESLNDDKNNENFS